MARFARARHLASLDPVADRVEIVRAMTTYEFPWDMVRSLELALFRTYAVPTIGRLLGRTGQFTKRTQKRYDDTQLLLYDMWLDGPKSERGQEAAEHLNSIHDHYRISADDFRYTLATFVVIPIRWLRAYGWRQPMSVEVDGWTNLMRDMGDMMRIPDVPATYRDFEVLLDRYEAEHFAVDAGGVAVAQATIDLMVSWYPAPARPVLRWAVPGLLEDHVLDALELPHPSARSRRLVESAVRLRGRAVRYLPPRPESRPFVLEPKSYPNGYELRDLGPETVREGRADARRSGARP